MRMRFGVGFPGCREGTAYPVGFVRPRELASVARLAEELGYYSIWSNDHLTTPRAVAATQVDVPNFYEPLVTYAGFVNITERLRFMLSVITLPQRDVVLLAKQVATLDRLSGGRVMLGVGLGGHREEFEAVHPGLKGAHRGTMLDEGIQGLRRLFADRRASFEGKYVRFAGVELAPKPVQDPFPVYVSAHSPSALDRAGRLGDGLIIAARTPDQTRHEWAEVRKAAQAGGRDPERLSLHLQTWLAFGDTARAAEKRVLDSQHFRRMAVGAKRTDDELLATYRAGNLLGPPEAVAEQVRAFQATGASHLGIIFVVNTMDELFADIEVFAKKVMPLCD
ncbi:MAG: LLM class flavin-dependent oxidoreductase [bacterium]